MNIIIKFRFVRQANNRSRLWKELPLHIFIIQIFC